MTKATPKEPDHPAHVKALLDEAGPDAVYDPVDPYPARPYKEAKAD